ncbi:MAG: SRPBCC family protein [Nitrospirae bacterium]|nr:SRPBCC family protein [Nitrospirota bacterium]
MVEIKSEIEIPVDSRRLWSFFIDSSNWPKIARFVEDGQVGEPFVVGKSRRLKICAPGLPAMPVKARIIAAEEGHLRWRGAVPGFSGEHYFMAKPVRDGRATLWIHGECFGGVVGEVLIRLARARLAPVYEKFNEGLAAALKSQG